MAAGDGLLASQMIQRLLQSRTFEAAIQTILDDVIALLGAEYGNIQLSMGEELAIVAQRGLSADFLKTFRRVKKEDGSACGRALRLGETVIIRDVATDPEFIAFRMDAKKTGFRSVQSTPICGGDGNLLGIVSTHFVNVHEPTPIEMQTLKTYSVVAAELLDKMLGEVALATKAEQMSEDLYPRISSLQDSETKPRSSDASFSA
jgi:GAF domain-containing protein